MGIGPGDEVICPAFTFFATAEAIARRGATPVFAEVDPETLNLDPEDVAARITPRTRAIMPVHLFGRPAPLDELAELGLPLIEDAAQAFGSPEIAQARRRLDLQLLPDEEPVRARRRRPRRRARRGARRARPAAALPRLEGEEDVRAHRLQLAARRAPGRVPAHLPAPPGRVDAPAPRGRRRGTRELGLGELVEVPEDEPGHVYHLFVCRSPQRDAHPRGAAERGIATAHVLPAAAPPPAGARATSTTARARCP